MMMEFMVLFLSTLMAVEGGLVTKAKVLPLERVQSGHAAHPRRDVARTNFLQFPLYGDRVSQGYYMTKLWLGTPPREYRVLIDTGSDITWLSCKTNFTGQHTRFALNNSSTAEIISCKHPACRTALPSDGLCEDSRTPCQYQIIYEDKTSTNGYYVLDNIILVTNDKRTGGIFDSTAKFIFGCSTFRSLTIDADGILGLGIEGASMVIQLYSQGKVPRVFSHCLSDKMHGDGFLVFGEVELPNISYSQYDPSRLHYSLSLESISVGGKTLPINPDLFTQSSYRGTIVDSGTTNGFLVAEAFDHLLSFISKIVSPSVYTFDNFVYPCFTNDSLSSRDLFPLIRFNFVDGASMALHPTEYLLEESYSPGFTCIGFGRSEDFTILGDLFLKDKIIIYDLERQMIGWRVYDCSVVPEVRSYPPSGPKSKAFISADFISTLHRMVAAVFLHLMFIYA